MKLINIAKIIALLISTTFLFVNMSFATPVLDNCTTGEGINSDLVELQIPYNKRRSSVRNVFAREINVYFHVINDNLGSNKTSESLVNKQFVLLSSAFGQHFTFIHKSTNLLVNDSLFKVAGGSQKNIPWIIEDPEYKQEYEPTKSEQELKKKYAFIDGLHTLNIYMPLVIENSGFSTTH